MKFKLKIKFDRMSHFSRVNSLYSVRPVNPTIFVVIGNNYITIIINDKTD